MARKRLIERAFSAAERYEEAALVQRETARILLSRIAARACPANARVLEIGCGTGFLTAGLVREGPVCQGTAGHLFVTDLSPNMVMRARQAAGAGQGRFFLAMDGERPCFDADARFDLICSNLAFQWFDNLGQSIVRLSAVLAPGGMLAFTTMAEGSFAEWRAAHDALGLASATPAYPAVADIARLVPAGMVVEIEDVHRTQQFAGGHAFLRHLKAIGAHVPRAGTRPLAPGALRKVMRAFDQSGARATYHVACCIMIRPR